MDTDELFLKFACEEKASESIYGSGAWDDLLSFNNGLGGQMNCQDGNRVYLKPSMGENVQTGNIHAIQSFSGTACSKYLVL